MEATTALGDVTAQYQKLNETEERLRFWLARDAGETVAAWEREIVPLIDEFDRAFREYITERDRGGFMGPVLEQRPSKSRTVDRLRRQADGFIAELGVLKVSQGQGETSLESMAARVGRLRKVLDGIHRHQDESNGLAQHVFCQDIGFPGAC